MSALDKQEGGNHYKTMKIQPTEYNQANGIGWCEGNIIKYASRHKAKNGAEDVKKIIHYAELLLQLEYTEDVKPEPDGASERYQDELLRHKLRSDNLKAAKKKEL